MERGTARELTVLRAALEKETDPKEVTRLRRAVAFAEAMVRVEARLHEGQPRTRRRARTSGGHTGEVT